MNHHHPTFACAAKTAYTPSIMAPTMAHRARRTVGLDLLHEAPSTARDRHRIGRAWWASAVIAVMGAVLCAMVFRPLPAQAQSAGAAPAPQATASQSQSAKVHQALLDKADAIAERVSALRGLARKRPIVRDVITKEQIETRLLSRIDEEYDPGELAAEELALKRMGLIAHDANYKQMVIELLTDQIAGFYDPIERKLYITANPTAELGPGGGDIVMAHEIDHALQDQHFNLRAFMKPQKENGDASVARQALVEGDGTALMLEFMLDRMGLTLPWESGDMEEALMGEAQSTMLTGKLAQAPLVLRESLIFPYLAGLGFVAHFRKHHPWSRIDAIYAKPPLSTEHILHPDSYVRYERPDRIKPSKLAALPRYDIVYHNVTGEMGLAILLRQHAPKPKAAAGSGGQVLGRLARKLLQTGPSADDKAVRERALTATAGWGGDRVAIYVPPKHDGNVATAVAISYTIWDHPVDAVEYFTMLREALPALASAVPIQKQANTVDKVANAAPKEVTSTDDLAWYADSAGNAYVAQRRDDAVLLILGAPGDRAQAVIDETWRRWRTQRN